MSESTCYIVVNHAERNVWAASLSSYKAGDKIDFADTPVKALEALLTPIVNQEPKSKWKVALFYCKYFAVLMLISTGLHAWINVFHPGFRSDSISFWMGVFTIWLFEIVGKRMNV